MINQEELVICRRRGHVISILDKEDWAKCNALRHMGPTK